jgi:homoserine dehydrogenase
VKLLAHAERDDRSGAIHLHVRPTLVPEDHTLFGVDDSENAVMLASDMADHLTLRGLAAGGASTASAVVSDIVRAVRDPAGPAPHNAHAPARDAETIEVAGYVRLIVHDVPEARELVLQALADRGVAVAECVAKPPLDGPSPQLVILTAQAPRGVHDRALETLDSLQVVRGVVAAFDRIEPT